MIKPISFFEFDHSFCEYKLYNFEYFNTFSSLIITLVGLYGYYSTKKNNNINQYKLSLFASFIINGISSAGYHSTNNIGWGLMDRMSMILISYFSLLLCSNELIKKFKLKTFYIYLSITSIQTFIVIMLTICGLHQEHYFNILFGFFFVFLLFFVKIISQDDNEDNNKNILKKGKIGISILIAGSLIWLSTEAYCDTIGNLQGHSIWHICCSIGGYLIISVADNLEYKHIV